MIRNYISDDVRNELPIGCMKTQPIAMINTVKDNFGKISEKIYWLLESKAEYKHRKVGKYMGMYFEAHQVLRKRMYQSQYSHIGNEKKTVREILNGLAGHLRYRDAPRAMCSEGLPDTVRVKQD